MEASPMVQYTGHGMLETALERLNWAEVMEVWIYRDVFLGQFLRYH